MSQTEAWPPLPYKEWAATKKTLHMVTQMLGKTRLALAPPQPEWLHSCLYLQGRGLTTGPMPYRSDILSAGIDLLEGRVWLRRSDGRRADFALGPNRCVADMWHDYQTALADLGAEAEIWQKPQEVPDTTHFSENRHDCTFEPEHAQRFFAVLGSIQPVLEEFRSHFFGRSGVQFWWGTFDQTVLLFSGKKLEAPTDRGYIMLYDLDAEHFNAGFWPGDDDSPEPSFYGYLVPRPPGCEVAPIEPRHANWVEGMGEWLLPYEAVRTSDDPRRALLDFLHSIYRVALNEGGWPAEAFEYTAPAPPLHKQGEARSE